MKHTYDVAKEYLPENGYGVSPDPNCRTCKGLGFVRLQRKHFPLTKTCWCKKSLASKRV